MHVLPIFSVGIFSHRSTPVLGIGLSKLMISSSSQVCRLLDGILTKNIIVSFLLELNSILRDGLLLSDNSNTPGSIKSIVCDLGLERETLNLGQIEILHLKELGYLF